MLEWITNTIADFGYVGIALLMFAENIFPPIPSELIMPLAGFTASQGKLGLLGVLLAGLLGTLLGALPWYYAGRLLGTDKLQRYADRYGRFFGIHAADVAKADAWFDRHGRWVVLFGRLIPGVRTIISAPAGSCGMPLGEFLLYSAVGSLLWCVLLAGAGYGLGEHYQLVEHYIAPFSKIALASLALGGVAFMLYQRRLSRRQKE
jgi:membrane protein DedA with SNARE-associated domain